VDGTSCLCSEATQEQVASSHAYENLSPTIPVILEIGAIATDGKDIVSRSPTDRVQ
jgi:hypothetical protein